MAGDRIEAPVAAGSPTGTTVEVRELLDKGETEPAQYRLYQVHHGMPKHKQLMHMLEDVAIRRLRTKMDDPYEKKLIHTVRGVGYVLEERDE